MGHIRTTPLTVLDVPREAGVPGESSGFSEGTTHPQLPRGESGGGKLSNLFLILSLISFLVSSLLCFLLRLQKIILIQSQESLSRE